ncbi:MAG: serine protease [Herminiimonas sp.]|nr:serine protease [Herminiimonas sp.]
MLTFTRCLSVLSLVCFIVTSAPAAELAETIKSVKPSIVGIGTYQKTRSPPLSFRGTGFAVGDGLSIITNAHVIPDMLDSENKETLGIIIGSGPSAAFRPAVLAGLDKEHDLAHLKITGTPLPPMKIGDSNAALEGQGVAFTGFPLGMMLGPYHSTHRATIASIAPLALPVRNSSRLDPKMIAQLKSPSTIFQLDGTAYPGNSGSPLYDTETGTVVGVINMVFVKGIKESAITNPSGITYAIPSNHVIELLKRATP